MKIEVQFFSRLRDIVGASQIDLEVRSGATLDDLLAELYARYPAMRPWDPHLLIAVGLDYAPRHRELAAGQSVSIMPPVQGG